LSTDENSARSFYGDWTHDGQPRLSAPPVQAPSPTYAPTAYAAPVAPVPTYGPPAAAAAEPAYAPAFSQFSRDPYSASRAAPAPYTPQRKESGSGLRNILIGFGIALVGTIVTVTSFNASGPGGTFVVAWGAIVFGGIQGIRGIVQLLRD
jgi:hypothetical protein